jgi:hypothetical protein
VHLLNRSSTIIWHQHSLCQTNILSHCPDVTPSTSISVQSKSDLESLMVSRNHAGCENGLYSYSKQWIETLKAAIEVMPNPFGGGIVCYSTDLSAISISSARRPA